jgi:hypothetical protein
VTAAGGGEDRRPVVLSYGLGVDSTAILLRWLRDPPSRDFDLRDLVVLTAQTGDEWPETGELVERHVYPLLRSHGVRTVQVARAGPAQADGIVVLDDTRSPRRCHIGGAYRLSDELFAAGTVPQAGGPRKCSLKFKGWVLDQWVGSFTAGRVYDHVVGFELGELSRMWTDQRQLGIPGRRPWYPLIEWGWHRADAEEYIRRCLGVDWPKSACRQCPFALCNGDSRARTLRRYIAHPAQAVMPLALEHAAVALNPRQGLAAGRRLADMLAAEPGAARLLAGFAAELDGQEWAVYEVRRAFRAKAGDPSKPANAVRSCVRVARGSRGEMAAELVRRGAELGAAVEDDGPHRRVWLRRKSDRFPCVEHMLTVAPAVVPDKTGPGFAAAWQAGLAAAASRPAVRPPAPRPVVRQLVLFA